MFLRFRKNLRNTDVHDLTDRELILKYRDVRNPEVIAVLFQRYTHLVYGVCLKYLKDRDNAKDAVMEIFEGLLESLLKHEINNFKSWLHTVTRNHCLMKLRKDKVVLLDIGEISEKIERNYVEFQDDLHQDVVLDKYKPDILSDALKTLKEPQRRCIELVYLEDRSYQEVCEITGYSMNEVKSHVQNGKRNLKIKLETKNE
jgi:RNA polymerase sigma factor (sigma-70 family)